MKRFQINLQSRYFTCILLPLVFAMSMGLLPPLMGQPDYSAMNNWAYHPDKQINLLANYNLDIAIIGPGMTVDSVIAVDNKATENTGLDIFFVHPTFLSGGYTEPDNVALNEQPLSSLLSGIIAQGGLLAQYGRFYAPRYRQATPPTFLGTPDAMAQIQALGTAYADVRAAFLHYLSHDNQGNDFILAAHSQGSYLLSMLLREIIAPDEDLKSRMLAAVPAGMVSVYDVPGSGPGAWWEDIKLCTEVDECHCVMTWRSYGFAGASGINPGHPAYNELAVDSGWIQRSIEAEDWVYQDSLYYGDAPQPLRYFIEPNGGDTYGTGTGFVAFDGLYSIRHRRLGPQAVGFEVIYDPAENDQRPDVMAEDASDPLFPFWGFHRKDYHIYLWALLQQLEAKMQACQSLSSPAQVEVHRENLSLYPNPSNGWVRLQYRGKKMLHEELAVYDAQGRVQRLSKSDAGGRIDLRGLSAGAYVIQSSKGAVRVLLLP